MVPYVLFDAMIKMSTPGNAAQADIDRIEDVLRIRLSPDCRVFLHYWAGSIPEDNRFWYDGERTCGISRFLSCTEILREVSRLDETCCPVGSIPIAYCSGGNLLLMDARSQGGQISFWDHEIEGGSQSGIHAVASSVKEFIEGVAPFDQSAIGIKPGQCKRVWVDPELLREMNLDKEKQSDF